MRAVTRGHWCAVILGVFLLLGDGIRAAVVHRCFQPYEVENGSFDPVKDFYDVHETVRFRCKDSHELHGPEELTCGRDGEWSDNEPRCEENVRTTPKPTRMPKATPGSVGRTLDSSPDRRLPVSTDECLDPPPREHATHNGSGTPYAEGTVLRYRCNIGYTRQGYRYYRCQDGKWKQDIDYPFTCTVKSCGHPGDIVNGEFDSYVFTVASVVKYSCNRGYEVHGRANLECRVDGKWSDPTPSCQRVNCGRPPPPKHGKVRTTGTTYESRATVTCDEGYEQQGSRQRTCGADRAWSGEDTVCREIRCDKPSIENGEVSVEEPITYGTIATFRCPGGRVLIGVQTAACIGMNQWSQDLPTCVDKCTILKVSNGTTQERTWSWGRWTYRDVTVTEVDLNSVLYVSCNLGYELSTASWKLRETITCKQGTWDRQPTCERKRCKQYPRTPHNGKVHVEGRYHGDKATYLCNQGYRLRGAAERTCWNGGWTESPPTCKQRCGNRPAQPENGRVDVEGQGDKVRYTCNHGYSLSGPAERTCKWNGRWSGTKPTCQPECTVPVIPNGNVLDWWGETLSSGLVPEGTRLDVSCIYGHQLRRGLRKKSIKCSNGAWPDLPTCDKVKCFKKPTGPENGLANVGGHFHGDKVRYSCNNGYWLSGAEVRNCSNGKWTGTAPTCKPLSTDCMFNASNLESVSSNASVFSSGMEIRVTCKFLNGSTILNRVFKAICENGNWSPARPTCVGNPCKPLQTVANAAVVYGDRNADFEPVTVAHLEEARIQCDDGYSLSGEANKTCKFGEWRGPEFGSCQPKSCLWDSTEVRHGEKYIFYCDNGTHLNETVGNAVNMSIVAECKLGKWDPKPQCNEVIHECFQPYEVESGYFEPVKELYEVNDVVRFGCNGSRELQGAVELTCGPDGQWLEKEPRCEVIQRCSKPHEVESGYFEPVKKLYKVNDMVRFGCNGSRELQGAVKLTCGPDGQWSGKEPRCEDQRCVVPFLGEAVEVTYRDEQHNILNKGPADRVPSGSNMFSRCKEFGTLIFRGASRRVCSHGNWTGREPTCEKTDLLKGGFPEAKVIGNVRFAEDGTLQMKMGTVVVITCKSPKHLVWMKKNGNETEAVKSRRKTTSEWKHNGEKYIRIYAFYLDINTGVLHSSTYRCTNMTERNYFRQFHIEVTKD